MKQKILAICDDQPGYADKLAEYISHKKENPYMVYGYQNVDNVDELQKRMGIDILLISQGCEINQILSEQIGRIYWLTPEGGNSENDLLKYQSAENIFKIVYEYYIENLLDEPIRIVTSVKTKLIGLYSPVKRCAQTTFGLALGQALAKKKKTLYLNFEGFSGFQYLMSKTFPKDLSDILYYFQDSKEKFPYKLKTAIEKVNDLDYIPPVLTPQFLQQVSCEEWMDLLGQILKNGEYEYVILDLSDYIQGLFEILRMCHCIYTLETDDIHASAKMAQYEQLIELQNYQDILQKTYKKKMPVIKKMPDRSQWFTIHEWNDCIEKIMKEEIGVNDG